MALAQHVVEVEADAGNDYAAPGAEGARKRSRRPVAVDNTDVRRAADRLLARGLLGIHRPRHREGRRLDVAQRLETDREQAAPARRPRVRADLTAAIGHFERVALDHPVAGEVFKGDRDVRRDPLGEFAAVKALRTFSRDALE